MTKFYKLPLVLLIQLLFQACYAYQEVLQPSPRVKYTLDDIVPMKHEGSGKSKCCPPGTEFNGESCLPVPICPQGTVRKHSKCVTTPLCPPGTSLSKSPLKCVAQEPPTCPQSMVLDGSKCVEKASSSYSTSDGCSSRLVQEPICNMGQRFNGTVCTGEYVPICPAPLFLEGGGDCVSLEQPRCLSGQIVGWEMCASPDCASFDDFCPVPEPLCPRHSGQELSVSGKRLRFQCDTCWYSDPVTIRALGNTVHLEGCMKACADQNGCAGCNFFPSSGNCNCHTRPNNTPGGKGECTAITPL
jgi:hypothetical protein